MLFQQERMEGHSSLLRVQGTLVPCLSMGVAVSVLRRMKKIPRFGLMHDVERVACLFVERSYFAI